MKERQPAPDKHELPSSGIVGALLVLGKNFRSGTSSNGTVQDDSLDQKRRITVLGVGLLHGIGVSNKIIIFSNPSLKQGFPSQARLMRDYLKKIFPHIKDQDIILEEALSDSADNIEEVKKILRKYPIKDLGLVTLGLHIPDEKQKLFRKAGLHVEPIQSREILAEKFPEFVTDYKKSPRFLAEIGKEVVTRFIQTHKMLESIFVSRISMARA